MAVLNDYICKAHGVFESRGPFCPDCGAKGELTHLKPPAAHTGKVQFVDGLLNRVLGEFGMTDVPKAVDSRETNVETRRIKSRPDQPLPTVVPGGQGTAQVGSMQVPLNINGMNKPSAAGREAFRALQGGAPIPFGKEVARAPSSGSRRPTISMGIKART
ncbi:MAG: hypothetical protein ACRD52_00720 [Candidatus Acidiferrales bacterium]